MPDALSINTILYWPDEGAMGRTDRVLWFDIHQDVVVTIDIEDPKAFPVFRNYAVVADAVATGAAKREKDPYARYRKQLSRLAQSVSNRRWTAIQPVVIDTPNIFSPAGRERTLADHAAAFHYGKTSLYKWLRWYWQRGQSKSALLPNWDACGKTAPQRPRGRPPIDGMANITSEDTQNMIKIARNHLWVKDSLSLTQAHQKLREQYYSNGKKEVRGKLEVDLKGKGQYPSLSQFRYVVEGEARKRRKLVLQAKLGERGFNLRGRALIGNSKSIAHGPGAIYAIDSTIGDLYARSSITGAVLERVTLYVVLDWFSQMIVGFHVSFGKDSYFEEALALDNAFRNKVCWAKELGREISREDWPCEGVATSVYSDRGVLKGPVADHMAWALNFELLTAAPYRADWKGSLERYFEIQNHELLHLLPGAVRKNRERGDTDPRFESTLTIHEIRLLILDFVLWYNKHHGMEDHYPFSADMMADKVPARPTCLWNWGVNRYGGPREEDPVKIRLHLLPGGEATLTEGGLKLGDLYYLPPEGIAGGWLEAARAKRHGRAKTEYVQVAHDPRCVNVIFLRHEGVQDLHPCTLAPKSEGFLNRDLWEVKAEIERRKAESKSHREESSRDLASVHARRDAILEHADKRLAALSSVNSQVAKPRDVQKETMRERGLLNKQDSRNFMPVSETPAQQRKAKAISRHGGAQTTPDLFDRLAEEDEE